MLFLMVDVAQVGHAVFSSTHVVTPVVFATAGPALEKLLTVPVSITFLPASADGENHMSVTCIPCDPLAYRICI